MQRKLAEFFSWRSNFQKTRIELFQKPQEQTEEGASGDDLVNGRWWRGSPIKDEATGRPAE